MSAAFGRKCACIIFGYLHTPTNSNLNVPHKLCGDQRMRCLYPLSYPDSLINLRYCAVLCAGVALLFSRPIALLWEVIPESNARSPNFHPCANYDAVVSEMSVRKISLPVQQSSQYLPHRESDVAWRDMSDAKRTKWRRPVNGILGCQNSWRGINRTYVKVRNAQAVNLNSKMSCDFEFYMHD
jgi:hypothetical protein